MMPRVSCRAGNEWMPNSAFVSFLFPLSGTSARIPPEPSVPWYCPGNGGRRPRWAEQFPLFIVGNGRCFVYFQPSSRIRVRRGQRVGSVSPRPRSARRARQKVSGKRSMAPIAALGLSAPFCPAAVGQRPPRGARLVGLYPTRPSRVEKRLGRGDFL